MEIEFESTDKESARQVDCLLLPVFENTEFALALPDLLRSTPWLADNPALRDFTGRSNSIALLYGPVGAPVPRILTVGLGEAAKFDLSVLRNAMGTAMAACRERKFAKLALPVEALQKVFTEAGAALTGKAAIAKGEALSVPQLLEESILGTMLATYVCTGYHNKKVSGEAELRQKERLFAPTSLVVLCPEKTISDALRQAAKKAKAVSAGIALARDLVNGPANIVTPSYMGHQASILAKRYGFKCTIINQQEIREQGMGAFWAVAQGSQEPPCLIVLEHCPPEAAENGAGSAPIVLIGKGLTFDSGGISLKPPTKMHEMKGDMAGAAAVLGVFAALGENPSLAKRRVIGLMPCTENMPGGHAVKPGDVIVTLSGKTVEITNTDAEGRLVLCDVMTMAQKRWRPALLVDIATLTGGCVVALGTDAAGLFCRDERLAEELRHRGERMGERFWPLPLWDDKLDMLKSDVADLGNVGPREGATLWAALFLSQFVEEGMPWVHLDIAGPGYSGKANALCPSGGTGFGVRTLYELAVSAPEKVE